MSTTPERRPLLPLLTTRTTGRQAVTCKYRCGDACSHPAPNTSDNEYFGDIVRSVLTRRGLLRSGAVVAVAGAGAAVFGGAATAGSAAPAPGLATLSPAPGTDFTPVAPNTEDA
ncbi:MAG: phosphatase, partial [Thermocrispum sp.]